MTRERCFFLFLILIPLHFFIVHSASSSCPTNCAGIEIPYPFGIGEGCYLNKWYELECLDNSTTILSKYGKKVVDISLPRFYDGQVFASYGSIRISHQITSKGCPGDEKEEDAAGSPLNLTGSPYYVGPRNNLVAVGCNFSASLVNAKPSVVACSSSCNTARPSSTHVQNYLAFVTCQIKEIRSRCNATSIKNERFHNGIGYCQTRIPDELQQVVGVKIDDENTATTSREGCKVAFLTDEAFSVDPKDYYATRYATVQLGWFIHTQNASFIDSLGCQSIMEEENVGYENVTKTKCDCEYFADSNSATCACKDGYRGNPYILNGCEEIDECLEILKSGQLPCDTPEWTCVNERRGHRCLPPKNHLIKTKAIAIGIGASFGSLILVGGVYWLYKFIKRRRRLNQKRMFFKRNGGLLLQQQLISTPGNVEKTKIFSSKELEKATENFSSNRVLGQGGQGMVYKGMLVDGGIVAVKKSKAVDEDKLEEFINEVVILSQINHRNIVKLLGCCLETDVPILVYEFIPNGNLFEHLHEEFDDYTMTTWEVRLRIAVDVAGALSYLHSAASFPIYHRDIKSTNIMLDEKYRAKVSDFGTSRSVTVDHTHLTTVVSGTPGYVDPEYFQSNQFTDKSDVYSFGVVLVELITGGKPFQENRTLATYFITAMKENRLDEIIDARIREESKLAQITATAKLARRCLNFKGRKRPNMREVSIELERIRSSHGDSQSQIHLVESDDEEETVEVNVSVQTLNNVAVTDTFAISFSDAEPLFPRQTW